jgi:hypothetical protein
VFGVGTDELSPTERALVTSKLRREMLEIFYGRNMSDPRTS